ncbi:MAG TPA: N-acetylmuramoyl-L-alanine amidase [Ignavibacteriales bacterium]|nr:N-acetylmuramoyl-L-alanine amidase [Ignavibacteriales bacterium]
MITERRQDFCSLLLDKMRTYVPMRMRLLLFSILIAAQSILAQGSITFSSRQGQVKDLKSINKKGVEFISVRDLASALKATVFFNPSNGKIEVGFGSSTLKLTSGSKFIVLIHKSDGSQEVKQIPLPVIQENNDLFVPFEFCSAIFSSASKDNLTFNTKLSEITEGSKESESKEAEKPLLVKNENEKKEEIKKEETKKETPEKKSETEKKTKTEKKTETESLDSKYDIQMVSIETKSNGTLINIKSKKKIGRYSSTIKDGTLYLNILGLSADENKIESLKPEGLIKKINVKKVGSNTQMEFSLADGYSTSETFPDDNGMGLLITIHNKLLSKKSSTQEKQKERWTLNTVVIDAGHGGKDPGTIGVDGVKEKEINLAIALRLGKMIQENMEDVKVVYTRSKDNFVELYKRGKIANENNGNLFISIHCNATPQKPSGANGFEIYLLRPGRTKEAISIAERENSVIQYEDNRSHYQKLTDENFILVTMAHSSYMRYSEQFSDILNKQFNHDLEVSSNGVKQAGFYVLVGASMPSVLVETGFLSNRKDAAYLKSKQGQGNIAESIFKAIKSFKSEYDKVIQAGL